MAYGLKVCSCHPLNKKAFNIYSVILDHVDKAQFVSSSPTSANVFVYLGKILRG